MSKIAMAYEATTPALPAAGVGHFFFQGGSLYLQTASGTAPVGASGTFVAGPTGSSATYTGAGAIIAAVAAAVAALPTITNAVVEVLPGSYTGNVTLPAGVSLVARAGQGTVTMTGDLTLTATSGTQLVSGIKVNGDTVCDAGGASTATVYFTDCHFNTAALSDPALATNNSGWVLYLLNCILETPAGGIGAYGNASAATTFATRCQFRTQSVDSAYICGGTVISDCSFFGAITYAPGGINSHKLINTAIEFPLGPQAVAINLNVGITLNVYGWINVVNLLAAGQLTNLLGTLTVAPGTFLGAYQTATLPGTASDGALAWSTDALQLYIVQSGSWVTVGAMIAALALSWTQKQTFSYTQFNNATVVTAATDGNATRTMTDSSDAPMLRMTNVGARTVTLFTPLAGDEEQQWLIHDAARTASAATLTITAPGVVPLNGVAGGSVTITTDGGAKVLRVTSSLEWETVGS
jgi:hypothetical protein